METTQHVFAHMKLGQMNSTTIKRYRLIDKDDNSGEEARSEKKEGRKKEKENHSMSFLVLPLTILCAHTKGRILACDATCSEHRKRKDQEERNR